MDKEIEFSDLLFKALDHAIDSVSTGEVLIPFVLTPSKLDRFITGNLETAKSEAEKYIDEHKEETLITYAYEGYLTVESNKFDALFVKGINRVSGEERVLAQRYKPVSDGKFEVIGNPILIKG